MKPPKFKVKINYNIYPVNYCFIAIPEQLKKEGFPLPLIDISIDPYSQPDLCVIREMLVNFPKSPEFKDVSPKWQDFLKEVLKIKADAYIFHN